MIANNREYDAYLDEMQIITILLPFKYHNGSSTSFTLIDSKEQYPLTIQSRTGINDKMKYVCQSVKSPIIGEQYWILDEHGGKTDLQIGAVIRTKAFDEQFFYDGPLGFNYDENETSFRLWAPTATDVRLTLEHPTESKLEKFMMQREEKGVWHISIQQNLEKWRYSFLICVNMGWKEAIDPYAVAVTMNGKSGVVVDLQKTKIERPVLPPFGEPTDALIYETHIRDFTIHPGSGVSKKGTYLGAGEVHTRGMDGHYTGLSYVKELGVTHLEFLPFHDFEGIDESRTLNEYNWGYNPLHFNAPDGSYATDPSDPYARIHELKAMISAVQSQGIRVMMDVVFNHVYIREHSSFEKIVPGYFFRHDEFGMPSNGTGVGNDIASERLMARKFILDSIMFWMDEYHIDGFRFDLMGILDVETMNLVREKVDMRDSTALIIGEGWDLNTPIPADQKANIRNQANMPRIGQFNDWLRDSIKGNTFNLYDKGYALGNEYYYEEAKQVIAGSIGFEKKDQGLFHSPAQSVNYVESHDNHTLWDKILVCSNNEDEGVRQRQHRLATVIMLLAQGIPFLHSGQEFFRTKQGIGNSYSSADAINQLDWARKMDHTEHVNYIKGIIEIRKAHKAFRFAHRDLICQHMTFLSAKKPIIGFCLDDVGQFGEWRQIIVFFNPTKVEQPIILPEGPWRMIADDLQANIHSRVRIHERKLMLKPISSYILVQ